MTSAKAPKMPIIDSPIATLVGVVESDIRFINNNRCQFTLKSKQNDLFFVQAFDQRVEICRTVKRGDAVIAITLPHSFKHNRCKKHHIYFELMDFLPV